MTKNYSIVMCRKSTPQFSSTILFLSSFYLNEDKMTKENQKRFKGIL